MDNGQLENGPTTDERLVNTMPLIIYCWQQRHNKHLSEVKSQDEKKVEQHSTRVISQVR